MNRNRIVKDNPIMDFKLNQVQITDEYCKNAFEKEMQYLKSLNADKLLAGFRETKGLPPKSVKYKGWESTEIKGHTLGHYLTAMSQIYASNQDIEVKKILDYIIDELQICQFENGYLFASDDYLFSNVENRKPAWVPWYTLHKIITGLVNVYKVTSNPKALDILKKLADWVYNRCKTWSEETQKAVLSVEYGGMNDCLYEVYKLTKDENHAYSAHMFDELELFTQIHNGNDILNGKHANTTIPKFLGALNRYVALGKGEEFYLETSIKFWDIVTNSHSYITGGNSEWEHFGEPDILDAERTSCNCETCNSYNMLKLTRELFKLTGDVKYSDFYENTFINAIVSSQNPETGMSMYFQPMATGYFKVYGAPFDKFWCCTGTGMESFTKLNDGIYFYEKNTVYVNQYLSSILTWEDANIKLTQNTDIPNSEKADFVIQVLDKTTSEITFKVRIPDWIAGDISAIVNGTKIDNVISESYLVITREWNDGDTIQIQLPMKITALTLADNPFVTAFKYGPIVLSAPLGTEDLVESKTGIIVSIPTMNIQIKDFITVQDISAKEWLENADKYVLKKKDKLQFVLKNTDEDEHLIFTPHYKQHSERYGIYWNIVESNSKEIHAYLEKKKAAELLESATIDCIPLGNDQYELEHKIEGTNTRTGTWNGYQFRNANHGGWFSYQVTVDPHNDNSLLVKYYSGDSGRTFDILINDKLLASETLVNRQAEEFYDKTYAIPSKLICGEEKANIKFISKNDSIVGSLFGVLRIVRA